MIGMASVMRTAKYGQLCIYIYIGDRPSNENTHENKNKFKHLLEGKEQRTGKRDEEDGEIEDARMRC